jgi:hypothetical protein
MMTHAQKRLREAVKYVSRQWGGGWPRISGSLQQALVRAEILAEIYRSVDSGTDPAAYREHVEALAAAAMRWEPDHQMMEH